jgi:threonine aldolase
MMPIVDLRSDTVTRPTAGMREAMMAAPLGDDVFGDDPTVNKLQERVAAMLGKEAALFMPSGTQSNLVAVMSHCARGDEYIVGQQAHTYRWEAGGAAVLGGVQPQPLEHDEDGTLALERIEAAIKPDDVHFARSRLLCLENTLGGRVMPLRYLEAATALAKTKGLVSHLDGARLFNAAVASGEPLQSIASGFDSISICFSKGLGAPIGSALVGKRDFIARARRWRKMAGGGVRQVGLLAAAADYALEHHVQRLSQDHVLASKLAVALGDIPGLKVQTPQTNIVFADLDKGLLPGLLTYLKSRGVLATGVDRLRFVTHLDVDAIGIERAAAAVRDYFSNDNT